MGQLRRGYPVRFAHRVRELFKTQKLEVPSSVSRMLICIDALSEQIIDAEHDIERIAENVGLCRRLKTVPGVGPLTAVRFLAVIDEVKRFPNAHALENYLGITPGEHSSSDRKRTTGITKAGSPKMRWTLIQAAWCAWRWRKNDPMVIWAHSIALRRGNKVAVTALARKMAGIMFAIWRDGSTYRTDLVHHDRRAPTSPTSAQAAA
jgi:transposase